jgi:hypothetical protein
MLDAIKKKLGMTANATDVAPATTAITVKLDANDISAELSQIKSEFGATFTALT